MGNGVNVMLPLIEVVNVYSKQLERADTIDHGSFECQFSVKEVAAEFC